MMLLHYNKYNDDMKMKFSKFVEIQNITKTKNKERKNYLNNRIYSNIRICKRIIEYDELK